MTDHVLLERFRLVAFAQAFEAEGEVRDAVGQVRLSGGVDFRVEPLVRCVSPLRIDHLNLQPFADDLGVTQECVDRRVFVGDVFQFGNRRTVDARSLVDVGQA